MKPTEVKKPAMVIKVSQRPSTREPMPCTSVVY